MMSDSDMYVGMERIEARYIFSSIILRSVVCKKMTIIIIMIPTGERIHMHVQLVARLGVNANLTLRSNMYHCNVVNG